MLVFRTARQSHRNEGDWDKIHRSALTMFVGVFVAMMGLCYCSDDNETFLGIPQIYGPSEALVKGIVEMNCEMLPHPENETVLLQLVNSDRLLGESTSLNGEAATFALVIKPSHEGSLQCVARAQNNSNISPTFSNTHYLKVIEPVKGARIVVVSQKLEFFEGEELELYCNITAGRHVSYQWLLNDQIITRSEVSFPSPSHLLINRTTPADTGSYVCEASNQFNGTTFTSRSSEVTITVFDVVSPDISYTVLKENSYNYYAVVTCHTTETPASPPVEFSLHNETQLVDSRVSSDGSAVFDVPVILGEYMGKFQCKADYGALAAYSQWLPLEIENVEGPVSLNSEYDVGENFAVVGVRLYCRVATGSHPQYQWFLNQTRLEDRGSFYHVFNQSPEQSILILNMEKSSAGTYHCVVSNSFDNTTAISSGDRYLDEGVLNRLPVVVVAVVFGCFIFLILLVFVCCGLGVVYMQRHYGEKSLLEMERIVVEYESELDLSVYCEMADVLRTVKGDEFDQASEVSVDEWPHIEDHKKNIENEPLP